jgi:microcystin-dependent protein
MAAPFIGEICCFGFNFAPRDWAKCNGQIMSIAQNDALFAILGTTYGGDGLTTFALPNLQGRIPMHWGTGTGGFNTVIGEPMGSTTVTLLSTQMPQHNHLINACTVQNASQRSAKPMSTSYVSQAKGALIYQTNPTINTSFSPRAISQYGNSQPHENMQPYLTLNFCIAQYGVFPTRN